MSLTLILAVLAATLFGLFAISMMLDYGPRLRKNAWIFPAVLSLAFLLFSLQTVISEAPFGFWVEHTRNSWGNQIWFDLLLAIGIGWFLDLPQAKTLGMRPVPWLVLIIGTGRLGFLAMVARMIYLRVHADQRESRLGNLSAYRT